MTTSVARLGARRRNGAAATCAAIVVLVQVAQEAPSTAAGDSLFVQAQGFRDDIGQAGCLLFAAAEGFPRQVNKAASRRFVRIDGRRAVCVFDGIAPGIYAVAVFHDANS